MIDPALVRDRLSEVEARLRTRGLDPARSWPCCRRSRAIAGV